MPNDRAKLLDSAHFGPRVDLDRYVIVLYALDRSPTCRSQSGSVLVSEQSTSDLLWSPTQEWIEATELDRFRLDMRPSASSSDELWQWSVDEPGEFWRAAWSWCGVLGNPGSRLVEEGAEFHQWRFLPDATMNFAENLLADRPGANDIAIVSIAEDGAEVRITWDELRSQVAAMASYFRSVGVVTGDRVAAWMPHVPETIVAFLAASSIGAVFTSTSADFGVEGVVDRFGQTAPKILVAADGYQYAGKSFGRLDRLGEIADRLSSVEHVVVVANLVDSLESDPVVAAITKASTWASVLAAHDGAELVFEQLPGDHPIYILYSSGTTGKPKCIVHRSLGVLLKHLVEQRLSSDIKPGDNVFFFTTCGWMMWNWLTSVLGCGATIVLYDGNPTYPNPERLFDLAQDQKLTLFGVSAKFIDGAMKGGLEPKRTHDLSAMRVMCSTGSPLSHEGYAWVYTAIKSDFHLASMSGGTDLCGCLVGGDPTKAVYAGEIQARSLGMGIEVFSDDATPEGPGIKGELVCVTPFPSMPLQFWGDDDGSRYRSAYFEQFDGVWAHGDFASWTNTGGMVIHGRSDATLNSFGVRIGTAEIYRVVEQLPEVIEAIAVGQEYENDTRVVLFVRLSDTAAMTEQLEKQIRTELRTKCSPRHVPAAIRTVTDIPRTRSGKIVEMAVTNVIHGREVKNLEALANPEALDQFVDRLDS